MNDPVLDWLRTERKAALDRHLEANTAYRAALAANEPWARMMDLAKEFDRTRHEYDALSRASDRRSEQIYGPLAV